MEVAPSLEYGLLYYTSLLYVKSFFFLNLWDMKTLIVMSGVIILIFLTWFLWNRLNRLVVNWRFCIENITPVICMCLSILELTRMCGENEGKISLTKCSWLINILEVGLYRPLSCGSRLCLYTEIRLILENYHLWA